MGHTSGLGNFAIRNGQVWVVDPLSQDEILQEIQTHGIAFEPGERVANSNSAYFLLRMIVERVDGRDYHDIVAQEIAAPLGLRNFESTRSHPGNTFKSYAFAGQWREIKEIEYSNVIGVGDIAATTHDLNVLITGLFKYKLLRRDRRADAAAAGWQRLG
ncbi:MAG: serine hydrolase domain-containing protein, partial [Stenotrophomonas sp.]